MLLKFRVAKRLLQRVRDSFEGVMVSSAKDKRPTKEMFFESQNDCEDHEKLNRAVTGQE